MSTFRQQYKEKSFRFGTTEESRLIRAEKHEQSRKKQRARIFNENRNISNSVTNTPQSNENQVAPKAEDRMTRLLKWKAERERRKKVEHTKKKPPFVVGVVHHKLYSPLNKDESVVPSTTHEKVRNPLLTVAPVSCAKRVTRATEKRLINKALAKKTTKIPIKNPNPVQKEQKNPRTQGQSFAPVDYKFKPPVGLNEVQLFGRVMHSMSPGKISELMSSSRVSKSNRKSGAAELIVEDVIDQKEDANNVAVPQEKDNIDDIEEGSIEAISLKLSSDEEEPHNSSNTSNNRDETFTYSNSSNNKDDTFDISANDMNDNNTKANESKEHETSLTEAPSSSENNTSISAHSIAPDEPVFFSPYIVVSRGKSNARKEEKIKRGFSISHSPSDDIPTKETVMKNLNISTEEEERTAQYFQFLLNREVDRLNDLCKMWTEIKESEGTEDAQYEIHQAVGQTNLLINKKFERFRRLVADCETGKGEMLVTCKDLQGFWDMMYMEVKNCDLRFQKLEKLRSQGWVEEEIQISRPLNKKKATVKKKALPARSSSIKTFLAEKKKMVQEAKKNKDVVEINVVQTSGKSHEKNRNSSAKSKTRKSMSVGSDENALTPIKPDKRLSLLQRVQLSETSKKVKSPLTIIKVSQMCKTPEVHLDDTISYVNSDQIPRKSILKQPKNTTEVESQAKSSNKVNFDDHIVLNEVLVDEETQRRIDLATALSRIDSFDFDTFNENPIKAERKLTFDDNSFDEPEAEVFKYSEIRNSPNKSAVGESSVQVPAAKSLHKLDSTGSSGTPLPRRSLRRQSAVDKCDVSLHEARPLSITSTPLKETTEDKVHSDDHIILNELPIDEETETKMDLASAQSRIDSFDLDSLDKEPWRAEGKIASENDSLEEPKEEAIKNSAHKNRTKGSLVRVQATTPLQKAGFIGSPNISKRSLRRQNAVDKSDNNLHESSELSVTSTPFKDITEDKDLNILKQKLQKHVSINDKEEVSENDESTRVLRNRIITSIDTPKAKRRYSKKMSTNVSDSEPKENKTLSGRRRRKSLVKVSTKTDDKEDLQSYIDNMHLEESGDKRRPSRSVKFADKDCSGCVSSKPALPVTPHVRKSKAHSIDKRKSSIVAGDLISWDTPEKLSEITTRSQNAKMEENIKICIDANRLFSFHQHNGCTLLFIRFCSYDIPLFSKERNNRAHKIPPDHRYAAGKVRKFNTGDARTPSPATARQTESRGTCRHQCTVQARQSGSRVVGGGSQSSRESSERAKTEPERTDFDSVRPRPSVKQTSPTRRLPPLLRSFALVVKPTVVSVSQCVAGLA